MPYFGSHPEGLQVNLGSKIMRLANLGFKFVRSFLQISLADCYLITAANFVPSRRTVHLRLVYALLRFHKQRLTGRCSSRLDATMSLGLSLGTVWTVPFDTGRCTVTVLLLHYKPGTYFLKDYFVLKRSLCLGFSTKLGRILAGMTPVFML